MAMRGKQLASWAALLLSFSILPAYAQQAADGAPLPGTGVTPPAVPDVSPGIETGAEQTPAPPPLPQRPPLPPPPPVTCPPPLGGGEVKPPLAWRAKAYELQNSSPAL